MQSAFATVAAVRLSARKLEREAEERLSQVSHDGVDALSYSDPQATIPPKRSSTGNKPQLLFSFLDLTTGWHVGCKCLGRKTEKQFESYLVLAR